MPKTKDEVWVEVAVATCKSSNVVDKDVAIIWADYIAERYEERFLR